MLSIHSHTHQLGDYSPLTPLHQLSRFSTTPISSHGSELPRVPHTPLELRDPRVCRLVRPPRVSGFLEAQPDYPRNERATGAVQGRTASNASTRCVKMPLPQHPLRAVVGALHRRAISSLCLLALALRDVVLCPWCTDRARPTARCAMHRRFLQTDQAIRIPAIDTPAPCKIWRSAILRSGEGKADAGETTAPTAPLCP